MSTRKKIVINNCGECPWWTQNQRHRDVCQNVNGPDKELKETSKIPDWCLLEDDK